MERTDSGLIVPEGTIEKKDETWGYGDAKALIRAMKYANSRGVDLLIICAECRKSKRNPVVAVETGAGAEKYLVCACKSRRLESVWST